MGKAQKIFRTVKLFCMILSQWIHVVIHFSKFIECTTPRVNPSVTYGLWMIAIFQCRFINCNKYSTLVGNIIYSWGGFACVGAGSIWEISVPSAQYPCKPKTALKNSLSKTNKHVEKKPKENSALLVRAQLSSFMKNFRIINVFLYTCLVQLSLMLFANYFQLSAFPEKLRIVLAGTILIGGAM